MKNCIFCKIINKEIPTKIIASSKNAIAFLDINPITPGHTVVIPKKHSDNLSKTSPAILADVFKLVNKVSNKILKSKLKPIGFNYLSNQGEIASQSVNHFHVHIIPKYVKDEGFILKTKKSNKNIDFNTVYKILA
jgi:histidine triad (HIT) family protein